MYPLPGHLTPFPLIPFTTDNMTACTTKAAEGAKKAPRSPASSCFFISCCTISVTTSINKPEFSNDFL